MILAPPPLTADISRRIATEKVSSKKSSHNLRAPLDLFAIKRRAFASTDANARGDANNRERSNNTQSAARPNDSGAAFGGIKFSGEIRLQFDSLLNQQNNLPNTDNAAIIGNELSSRNRLRLRARLAMRGELSKEFAWGLRLSTGALSDNISAYQILTDFYTRKTFALDQAFIQYTPERIAGLRFIAGKFEPTWLRTEMTLDNDVQVEGVSETYERTFKNSHLQKLGFALWQLPFLERNSAFILGADGRVNLDASRRAGRDLGLYGAQARARFRLTDSSALEVSIADQYFSGTQFISPVQFFGSQLQLPVIITIPASGGQPAREVAGVVSIPRSLLVTGNSNLGLTNATNNAINRDGRLASGFNLVDVIARLEYGATDARFPMLVLLNYVRNTQTHDVSVAGANGATEFLRNDQESGFWAEMQVGRTKQAGDMLFGYTFTRIEKDAVLTPFNFSELAPQSDILAQRFVFAYTIDPHVIFGLTTTINHRLNGLNGVFGQTPAGSLNRTLIRLQLDTTFRF